MSFRHDKSRQFEAGVPDVSAPEWDSSSSTAHAGAMRELHLASESVLRLATRTYSAAARGDTAGADTVRESLKRQLALTTRLIDELVFNGTDPHMTH
ncbi:hypothetical protein [Paraburkholderia fungorum]|uniref:hypothetical protein n=1 Tax=Paraburkholderia fungorum TaxID=134537 RepID=UPI0038BBFB5B